MVFRGGSLAKMDAQGRLKIPSLHRKVLEDQFGRQVFVTSFNGRSVLIYPMEEWEKIEQKVQKQPRLKPEIQRFLRNTSYWGQETTIDKQGRLVIQPHLRKAAEIESEVSVIGYLNYLEVWNLERIEEQLQKEPYSNDDAATLADLGI